jgi:hypothetical protein
MDGIQIRLDHVGRRAGGLALIPSVLFCVGAWSRRTKSSKPSLLATTKKGRYFFAGVFLSIVQPSPPSVGPHYITHSTGQGQHQYIIPQGRQPTSPTEPDRRQLAAARVNSTAKRPWLTRLDIKLPIHRPAYRGKTATGSNCHDASPRLPECADPISPDGAVLWVSLGSSAAPCRARLPPPNADPLLPSGPPLPTSIRPCPTSTASSSTSRLPRPRLRSKYLSR